MSSETEKNKSELATFKLFAKHSSLNIIEGTIENRKPPEADIYCEIKGVGKVAFEFTEIINEGIYKRKNLSVKTKKLLYEYSLKKLSKKDAEYFKLLYSDALFKVEFLNTLSINKRESLLPRIFSHLLSLEPTFEGKTLNQSHNCLKGLSIVEIRRFYKNQPRFYVSQFDWYSTPSEDTLIKIFKKTYVSNHPIELLAHINYDTDSDKDNNGQKIYWHNIVESVKDEFKRSSFQKLWIFDSANERILFEACKPK